jgi:hypothetical protein
MSTKQPITRAMTRRRRALVLKELAKGKTMREVAGVVEDALSEDELPSGFDSRYVAKDMQRALDKWREEVTQAAHDYRVTTIRRLQMLLSGIWKYTREHTVEKVTDDGEVVEVSVPPDMDAVRQAIAITMKLTRLHGVDPDAADPFEGGAPNDGSDAGEAHVDYFLAIEREVGDAELPPADLPTN